MTLEDLLQVLASIERLAGAGKELFDHDERQRWSIERLWIFAGNLAERYTREENLDEGLDPWAELVAIRNVYAHYTPNAINYERVWADTTTDVDRITTAVSEHREPDTQ
ncbi:MAG: ribonuclease HepT family protein [Solirubrobacteraceae bacterium]